MSSRVPYLEDRGAHTVDWLKYQIINAVNYAPANGIDSKEVPEWKWPLK
jgi:xylulose-5-phosphate/fructose-6-phosphate phosphoketolase